MTKNTNKEKTGVLGAFSAFVVLLWLLYAIAVPGVVVYVIYHFVTKYW